MTNKIKIKVDLISWVAIILILWIILEIIKTIK